MMAAAGGQRLQRRAVLLGLAALPLGACGFQPLYARRPDGTSLADSLGGIRIAPIADRTGQRLRGHLTERLTPRGQRQQVRYELQVATKEFGSNMVLLNDASPTFARINLEASFKLIEIESGNKVAEGISRADVSFNLVQSQFANIAAREDARDRAAVAIADDIRNRLALQLTRKEVKG